MEVKKREVIASVVIVAIMLILGFGISDSIRQDHLEKCNEYDTAIHVDDEEIFRYGMRTNIGNAFVYGNLTTLDPVTFPEIQGAYSYVEKEEQEYRKHTRIVTETYKDSDGKEKTREVEEEYWTWDTMRTERKTSTKIQFLNVEFVYGLIPFPSSHYITTISTGYHRQNVYYGTDTDFQGTIYTILKDNTISKTSFYRNRTIDETIEHLESGNPVVAFWIFWFLLTAVTVVGFCYLENKWLD